MLYTNLRHIESANQLQETIFRNQNVMVICGRMGALSIPVFRIASELEAEYPQVNFYDMEYDNPESEIICQLAAEHQQLNIPVIVFFENGKPATVTSGMQTKEQLRNLLDKISLQKQNS